MDSKNPEFKTVTFPPEDIEYLLTTWPELEFLTSVIAREIINAGEEIDQLISIAKGGQPMGRVLYDELRPLKFKDTATIGIKSYDNVNESRPPEMYQKLTKELEAAVRGKNILLFDDLADSGAQLTLAVQYLKDLGAKKVITAALFYKEHSKFKPDYFAEKIKNKWVVFPYESFETMESRLKAWDNGTLDEMDIKGRFMKMDIPARRIRAFWEQRGMILRDKATTDTLQP